MNVDLKLDERHRVLEWMIQEWEYSNVKFGLVDTPEDQRDDHDDSMLRHGFDPRCDDQAAFWFRQVTQYFSRAGLFGVDTPQGRQALMKGLMTLFDACACMIRVHGDPPQPGVPSGEIREWEDEEQDFLAIIKPSLDGKAIIAQAFNEFVQVRMPYAEKFADAILTRLAAHDPPITLVEDR